MESFSMDYLNEVIKRREAGEITESDFQMEASDLISFEIFFRQRETNYQKQIGYLTRTVAKLEVMMEVMLDIQADMYAKTMRGRKSKRLKTINDALNERNKSMIRKMIDDTSDYKPNEELVNEIIKKAKEKLNII